MTAMTGGSAPGSDDPSAAADHPDRAARIAIARQMTRDAAAAWLTDDAVSAIGPAVAAAITRCRATAGREPTWAEALAGIDPQLLTPLTVVPAGWPLPPAVWRRDLRTRLMDRLKHAAWVTYTARPRSLQVGSRGRTWLTTTTTRPAPGNPQTAVTPLQG